MQWSPSGRHGTPGCEHVNTTETMHRGRESCTPVKGTKRGHGGDEGDVGRGRPRARDGGKTRREPFAPVESLRVEFDLAHGYLIALRAISSNSAQVVSGEKMDTGIQVRPWTDKLPKEGVMTKMTSKIASAAIFAPA